MSGITGTYHFDGRPADPAALQRMVDGMAERGPHGRHIWHEGPVGFGHCMLDTTPESRFERYPMRRRCSNFVLTADARIDNRDELIAVLPGARPNGRPITDGELILLAYDKWGQDCAKHLLGDFAFAIWDEREKRLFCARDPMGVKPFYYAIDNRSFSFGSTISPLLQLESISGKLNHVAIGLTFLLKIKENTSTFYSNIKRLPPAHSLTISDSGQRLERYWRLNPEAEIVYDRDEEYEEHFRELFYDAVSARLRSANGVVASALSGGLDSSSIVSAAGDLLGRNGTKNGLKTYSCVFPSVSKDYLGLIDERSYVRDVVSRYGIQNRFIFGDRLDPVSAIDDVLEYASEAPFQFNLYLHLAMYRQAAADGAAVFLDGIDGDTTVSHGWSYLHDLARRARWTEFCALVKLWTDHPGSPNEHYLAEKISRRHIKDQLRAGQLLNVSRAVRSMAGTYGVGFARVLKVKIWQEMLREKVRGAASGREKAPSRLRLRPELMASIREYNRGLSVGKIPHGVDLVRYEHCGGLEAPLIQTILESGDLSAGIHGIEPRYPFFDTRLIEFCVALPPEQKFKGGWPRSIQRRSMAPVLPDSISKRLSKSRLGYNLQEKMLWEAKPRIVDYLRQDLHMMEEIIDLDSAGVTVAAFERCSVINSDRRLIMDVYLLLSFTRWMRAISVAGRTGSHKNGNTNPQHTFNLKPMEVPG